jgi:Ca-activated chloride channel homolog
VKIICRFSRASVVENQERHIGLLVHLRAPAPKSGHRGAVCVLPVVDVSGSMAGAKLEAVKRALDRLVTHLVPGDRIGLITFDSNVAVPFPIREVTEAVRTEFRQTVKQLVAGSSTNLAGGFIEAARIVEQARLPATLTARAILLTDGQANEGPATGSDALVALLREQLGGLSLSAFGYGDDCDQALLAELASAGGGSYAYIQNDDQVLTAFARELGGLVSRYATSVVLRVEPNVGQPIEQRIATLLHDGTAEVVAKLKVAAHAAAIGVEIAKIAVGWCDASGKQQRAVAGARLDFVASGSEDADGDPDVTRAIDQSRLARAQEIAENLAKKGDFAAAAAVLVHLSLRTPEFKRFVREVLLPCYRGQASYAAKAGTRASSSASLAGRQSLLAAADVESALPSARTSRQEEMELSFRKTPH